MKSKLSLILSLTVLVGFLVQPTTAADKKDIVTTAVEAGSFKTLATAVKAAGLVETLQGKGPFTVFAPTDEAFAKLPKSTLAALLKPENKSKLTQILTYHVVPGRVTASQVVNLSGAKTVNGQRARIKTRHGKVTIDNAKVVKTDIFCTNGVIHVIDNVILPTDKSIPEIASAAGKFNTLLAAAKAAGLVDALSGDQPLTVFAPTDKAFEKLPAGTVKSLLKPENKSKLAAILKYHVVAGRNYADDVLNRRSAKTLQGENIDVIIRNQIPMLNNSKLVAADINASNGVIHIIDTVLMPPSTIKTTMKPISSRRMSTRQALQLVINTVNKGTDVFNHGDHKGCSEMYEKAIRTMTTQVDGLPEHLMTSLTSKLNKCQSTSCQTTRAWMLRDGLDLAYATLKNHR